MKTPRPYVIGASFVAVAMTAAGFLPLFGGPGYEHAIATGLLVPSAAAIATANDVARGGTKSPLASVGRGVVCGLAFAALALFTALVHGLRVGICEWWGALLYFALTAGAGTIMGGAWGAFVGELVLARATRGRLRRRRLAASTLALLGPIGCVVVSLLRFFGSPMIFAFDPFVGYFSGTLYDTVIDAGTPLLTYRFASLATLTALAFFAAETTRREGGGLGIALATWRALLGGLAALVSLGIFVFGTKLGHYSTTASIIEELGAEKHGARCDLFYPSTTREQDALLLVKDCDEELVAVEKRLGARGPERVRALFFRDAEQKKRLMGAAHTYIAKPWREEVYLQLGGYPHSVLAHELGHVVAGSFGHGPFRTAGSAGGLVPNPGLIEGVAVFASPEDEDLTELQWARAMKDIGILPPMERIFSLGFLGDASAKSYTLAGAFIGWIAERFGVETVRAWYRGEELTTLAKMDWPALDRAFGERVANVPLPPEAESFARAKFARPGIFGRKCPHVVDALRREADGCRDSQRYAESIRLYREAMEKDPADFQSRKELANVERRHGDRERGRAMLEALANDAEAPRTWRDRASEALADAELIDGQYEAAAARYHELAVRSVDEDTARTLEVKELGARDPDARPAVQALLLGDELHGADVFVGGVALGRWGEASDRAGKPSALARYLVGRNLVQRAFYTEGDLLLAGALAAGAPTKRIAREALRQRAIAACARSDTRTLAEIRAAIESPDDPFAGAAGSGRRDATLRMIERCSR